WGRIDWYPEVEHPDWFRRRAEMDAVAVALREYQERVIPGLLQTEEYARALFSRVAEGEDLEERVRARLSRQQRFLAADGPSYIVVLDESCLRNVVGGPGVMRGQCEALLRLGRRPNIRIQVAPAAYPELLHPNVSMSLIELPGGERWVYSESLDRGHFHSDPVLFAGHSRTYDVLRADSLSTRQTVALIGDVMEGYEHHGKPRSRREALGQEQLQRGKRRQLRRGGPPFPRRRPRA
ncbi:DUF5753 domain-containing protein, partial [Streptomyces vinaceusdrappus]